MHINYICFKMCVGAGERYVVKESTFSESLAVKVFLHKVCESFIVEYFRHMFVDTYKKIKLTNK